MILEHALLSVRPGQQTSFEQAFGHARAIIPAMPGFRGSADHREWRALLHGFYDPFPVVEHFATVLTADPARSGCEVAR